MADMPAAENSSPGERAIHRYELVEADAPAIERGWRWVGALILGFVTLGASTSTPGGQRIMIRDRASGTTVSTFTQGFGDGLDMSVHLQQQLATLSAAEFESRWLRQP